MMLYSFSTALTRGKRRRLELVPGSAPALFGDPGCQLAVGTNKVDGLVLARKVGYEDWVRRAAAIEPMARPPSSAIKRTIAR